MTELAEFEIIKKYFTPESWRQDVILGVGDDCAVLQPPEGKRLAVTVDTLVAGIHFPLDASPADIAYKAIAVSLSDLAAMGAEPAWVTLALTLPDVDKNWLTDFSRSFTNTLKQYRVQLVGGDTTRGPLSITVHATGFIGLHGAMQRNNAKPGDSIIVTGTLGDASLGLRMLSLKLPIDNKSVAFCLNKFNRPEPRVIFAQEAVEFCCTAIDVSDGLIADLSHVLDESSCGAIVCLDDIPLSDELKQYFDDKKTIPDWDMILAGGDDYELCMAVSPEKVSSLAALAESIGLRLTCIGEITAKKSFNIVKPDGQNYILKKTGYNHFNND